MKMDLGKMTDEQLIELLREGKTEITDYLMEKYKDMVRKQARAMYLWGGENDDLIQEGMIGLFKAVQDYDPKEGASFSSFAGLCVSRQMYTAIKASQRKKHLPLNSYVSIYASASDNPEENGLSIVDTIEAGKESNPELMILGEEYTNAFEEEAGAKGAVSSFAGNGISEYCRIYGQKSEDDRQCPAADQSESTPASGRNAPV